MIFLFLQKLDLGLGLVGAPASFGGLRRRRARPRAEVSARLAAQLGSGGLVRGGGAGAR